MFDAKSFLDTTFQGAMSTRLKPIPEGTYVGTILPLEDDCVKTGVSQKGNAWARLDVKVDLASDPQIAAMNLGKFVTVRAGILLELTPDGNLDTDEGKNMRLGRLREAAGLNKAGQMFNPRQLGGRSVRVKVSQRVDEKDTSVIYNDVDGFLPI